MKLIWFGLVGIIVSVIALFIIGWEYSMIFEIR